MIRAIVHPVREGYTKENHTTKKKDQNNFALLTAYQNFSLVYTTHISETSATQNVTQK